VAIAGYLSCGNMSPEIIINREVEPGDRDYAMNLAKFSLLICLIVGVIIRNQSNKAGLFGIIDQFQKLKEESEPEKNSINDKLSATGNNDSDANPSASGKLSEEINKASSLVLQEKIQEYSATTVFIVQFFNSLVPAITAILVKDDLINYVESGSGFLAPVFMIIYPCKSEN
jgi:hypothetical protein